jgi:hypothetical protein
MYKNAYFYKNSKSNMHPIETHNGGEEKVQSHRYWKKLCA